MDMLSVEENHNSRNIQVRIRQQKLQSGKHSVSTGQTLVQVCGMKSMKPAFLKRHLEVKRENPANITNHGKTVQIKTATEAISTNKFFNKQKISLTFACLTSPGVLDT